MRRFALLGLVTAILALAPAAPVRAACTSSKCPDQLAVDDLRSRIAARCDCAGASRKTWVRCVKQVTEEAVASGMVPGACAKAIRRCEGKTTCGKANAVVCCSLSKKGTLQARVMKSGGRCGGTVCTANPSAADACRPDATCAPSPRQDPGTGDWAPVPQEQVAEECRLDPGLLAEADAAIGKPYAIVRYGKLCHEYYPAGRSAAEVNEVFSTTKTLGALLTGVAAYQTRDLPRSGRKTGPISDVDRVDHWLDTFAFNPDAQIAHVLSMVAHNADLAYGAKGYEYDIVGVVQINRLSDIITTAIAQDPGRLGGDLEEFTQRFLYAPLGLASSSWTGDRPVKNFAFTWQTTVREMARVGLLLLNDGIWNGERLVDREWIYRMTHPAFEDSNPAYGYLTWLATEGETGLLGHCVPPAIHASYPHGLSPAPDCGYTGARTCHQTYDVGAWAALGLGGQVIMGHRGLDLVIVAKDLATEQEALWNAVRPAVVALDPEFPGDETAFCAAYDASDYAPDLR